MHKLIIRLKSGYKIPITCEDFTFEVNRLTSELLNYEIKGIKDNVPVYFRMTDVECIVEKSEPETLDKPNGIASACPTRRRGHWIIEDESHKCSICGSPEEEFIYGTEFWYGRGESNFCPNCGARMKGTDDAK